ncbi:phosphoglycolate phosphatase [uncultured Maritimibacter sp.]|jgi:phosphoglycolate phosphatase|uniref:phosphoglycolate phosphatase n=1 Tax=uncultured Maritimibacter sp. TaxID=991866 RepID=UPI000B03783D|nr:phosphoglycolate phosphatase [uncultured Maritimibacter sp.]
MTPPIVFDLDGTLVDSAPDIRAGVNSAMEARGLAPFALEDIIRFIGNGLPRLVERVAHARGVTDVPALHLEVAAAYDAFNGALTRPYPGVRAALASLAAKGHPLGICTNKPLGATRDLLTRIALSDPFAVVIGGDSLAVRKPDPAPLAAAFDALGPSGIFVGDSEVDAQTAQDLGVPFMLFTEGYRKSPTASIPHCARFSDWADVPGLVTELLTAS